MKVWSEAVWFCEAEYLSAKYSASCYQGNRLNIQDPIEIALMWCLDGLGAEIKERAKLWDKLYAEDDHEKPVEYRGKYMTAKISISPETQMLMKVGKAKAELDRINDRFFMEEESKKIDKKFMKEN